MRPFVAEITIKTMPKMSANSGPERPTFKEQIFKGTVINMDADIVTFITEQNEVKMEKRDNIEKIKFIGWSE